MSASEFGKQVWQERRSGPEAVRAGARWRSGYVRDRARVIHSAAFRRLQAKTQVLGIGEGDFHRTRLTHSMEAAQISRGIVRSLQQSNDREAPWQQWLPDPNLIETIALAHDIGHPPFGHGGEVALNYALRDAGGFEGNGQTLRLLSCLEAYQEGSGLDLTRRSLLGVLKYPAQYEAVCRTDLPKGLTQLTQLRRDDWKPPKCYMHTEARLVAWILEPFTESDRRRFIELDVDPSEEKHGKTKHRSFDTTIMELSDDIAYGVHDLEDAISLKMISKEDWIAAASSLDRDWASSLQLTDDRSLAEKLFSGSSAERKRTIGALVNAFIVSIACTTVDEFDHPLLRYRAVLQEPAAKFLKVLKDLVYQHVINTPQVQTLEYRGQQLIVRMFEAFASDPTRLLKENFAVHYRSAQSSDERMRVICDYIAGMTDEYATRMYERLFVPRHGVFSDQL